MLNEESRGGRAKWMEWALPLPHLSSLHIGKEVLLHGVCWSFGQENSQKVPGTYLGHPGLGCHEDHQSGRIYILLSVLPVTHKVS